MFVGNARRAIRQRCITWTCYIPWAKLNCYGADKTYREVADLVGQRQFAPTVRWVVAVARWLSCVRPRAAEAWPSSPFRAVGAAPRPVVALQA